MLDRVNPIIKNIKKSGIRRFSEAAALNPNVVSLTIGEPEFNTDEAIKTALIKALEENKTHYPVGVGVLALREAIRRFESKRSSVYSSQEVIVTLGSTQGLAAVFMSILEAGDEVIIPEPMYISYRPMIEAIGAKVIALDTTQDDFQINELKLKALVSPKTKAIVITSPNNPTGVIYTKESLELVKNVAIEHRLFVISDDVYDQLVYVDDLPSLRKYPELREQLIITQSFSKPYAMTGWRIGYVLASETIAQVIGTFHPYLVSGIPTFIQEAAIQALEMDTQWMRDEYRHRRDESMLKLNALNIPFVKPEGAFYFFIDIQEFKLDSLAFCEKALKDYDLAMVPGRYFGEQCDHYVRLSYAVSKNDLNLGLERLSSMVHDFRR